jgi:hypothetical protein
MSSPNSPSKPEHVHPDVVASEIKATLKSNSGGGKSHPEAATPPITPITVGEPVDAASLAIDQAHMEDFANPDMKPGVVECRRPPKGAFFTVIPEEAGKKWQNRAYYFVLETEGRDPHLIAHPIAEIKKDDEDTIRPVLLVRFVLMNGQEGLWSIKLNPPDGKANRWNTSAMNVLHIAESGKWVRIISKGEYRYNVSKKTLEEIPPKFTDRTFAELVNAAFPAERVVTSLDHPIWDELANGSVK